MKGFTTRKALRGVAIGLLPCLPLLAIRLWHWIVLGRIADESDSVSFSELSNEIFDPTAWIEPFTLTAAWLLFGQVFFRQRWPKTGSQYAIWLRTVPWSASKPLPEGPLTPSLTAWIAVLTTIAIASPIAGISILLPPLAFLLGWNLAALAQTARHDPWWVAVVSATVLLAALVMPRPLLPGILTALAMMFFLNRRLLAAIDRRCRQPLAPPAGKETVCYHQLWLHPRPGSLQLGTFSWSRIAWSVFTGLVFVFLAIWERRFTQSIETSASLIALASWVAALARGAAYLARLRPPLTLFGRLRHGRFIIPGYDRALVTPLLMLLALLPAAGLDLFDDTPAAWFGIPVIGITASAVTALFLCGGPNLSTWLMTAPCRMSGPGHVLATNNGSPSRKGRREMPSYC